MLVNCLNESVPVFLFKKDWLSLFYGDRLRIDEWQPWSLACKIVLCDCHGRLLVINPIQPIERINTSLDDSFVWSKNTLKLSRSDGRREKRRMLEKNLISCCYLWSVVISSQRTMGPKATKQQVG